MKFSILLTLFIFLASDSYTQSNNQIVIGHIDTVESNILNESRKIMIHLPEGYDAANQYPVVYLLDAGIHFTSVVGLLQQHNNYSGNRLAPEMIVVGIPNISQNGRTRDLTPTKAMAQPPMFPESMAMHTGGGSDFMGFIEKELIPYIESKYSTAPYRLFIGHSFGGLTVINTFFYKPELFNSYVAIDPSMAYDNEKLLSAMEGMTFEEKHKKSTLYLGLAFQLPKGMDTMAIKKDTSLLTGNYRSNLKLNALMKKASMNNFNYDSKFYWNDVHTSVPLITEYDAIRFIFKNYRFEIEPEDIMNPNSDIVNRIKTHYTNISEEYGYAIRPDESMTNYFGYMLLELNQTKMAEEFFKLNIYFFPDHANGYDSLGDYYLAIDNKEEAIKYYKQAVALNDYELSRQKLEQLQE